MIQTYIMFSVLFADLKCLVQSEGVSYSVSVSSKVKGHGTDKAFFCPT